MKRIVAVILVVGLAAVGGYLFLGGPPSTDWLDGKSVQERALLTNTQEAMTETVVRLAHQHDGSTSQYYFSPNESLMRSDDGVRWARNGVVVTNDTSGGAEYAVDYGDAAFGPQSFGGFSLWVRLTFAEYQYKRTVDREGHSLHELEIVGPNASLNPGVYMTGTARVDDRGRIYTLRGSAGENRSATTDFDYDFDWSAETVPDPSWIDTVPRGKASLVNDNRTFTVHLTGGQAIPANTTLSFWDGSTDSTVTIDERLTPGDDLFIAVDRNGSLVTDRTPLTGDTYRSFATRGIGKPSLKGTITTTNGSTVSVFYGIR